MRLEPVASTPPARVLESATYVASIDSVLVFGGTLLDAGGDIGEVSNDLWSWNPSEAAWSELHPVGPVPPARDWAALGYDPHVDKMILFGGGDTEANGLVDTWAYDPADGRWTELKPSTSPRTRGDYGHFMAMAYDTDQERMLLLTAPTMEVWSYDWSSNTWTVVGSRSADGPSEKNAPSLVYAADIRRLLLIGGTGTDGGASGEVWAFDPSSGAWTERANIADAGLGTIGLGTIQAAAYDPDRKEVIFCSTLQDEETQSWRQATFSYSPSRDQWAVLDPMGNPPEPGLLLASLLYDSHRGEFILLQGVRGSGPWEPNADVWTYNPTSN